MKEESRMKEPKQYLNPKGAANTQRLNSGKGTQLPDYKEMGEMDNVWKSSKRSGPSL